MLLPTYLGCHLCFFLESRLSSSNQSQRLTQDSQSQRKYSNKLQKSKGIKVHYSKAKNSNAGIKKETHKQDGTAAALIQRLEKDWSELPIRKRSASCPASIFHQENASSLESVSTLFFQRPQNLHHHTRSRWP